MNTEITQTLQTVAPGQEVEIKQGGAEIFLRDITGALEAHISLDGGSFIPIGAGEGFAAVHTSFIIKNTNAVTINVDFRQSSEAGTYIDRRDQATTVQIGGAFVVVNSPSIDEGGVIRRQAGSLYFGYRDATAGAITEEIITAAENTRGVRISFAQLDIRQNGNSGAFLIAAKGINQQIIIGRNVDIYYRENVWEFDSFQAIELSIPSGAVGYVTLAYDIL